MPTRAAVAPRVLLSPPETLRRWLADPTIRHRLQAMPPLLTERLRDCQIDAVTKLEASLAADHPRALIQMATGAGKTYTACVFSHRLLEHAKFRRVLFLADRANLVRQTRHEFEDFRPPGTGRCFTELYNVQRLGPEGLDTDGVSQTPLRHRSDEFWTHALRPAPVEYQTSCGGRFW
jgi:type I restriction enzyme, R subunit